MRVYCLGFPSQMRHTTPHKGKAGRGFEFNEPSGSMAPFGGEKEGGNQGPFSFRPLKSRKTSYSRP